MFVVSAIPMLSNQTRMNRFCSQLTGDALPDGLPLHSGEVRVAAGASFQAGRR